MLAYEMTHYIQIKRRGIDGYTAVKLDMSKPCDRMEWNFLRMMMQPKFNENWIDLIMNCVTTVRYRIKLMASSLKKLVHNGVFNKEILCPLSFLVMCCSLFMLLLSAETTGDLCRIKVCQNAPSINHLLFADDSLLLLKANEWSANHLQNILSLYVDCSGKTINKDKSSVMFSITQRMPKSHR